MESVKPSAAKAPELEKPTDKEPDTSAVGDYDHVSLKLPVPQLNVAAKEDPAVVASRARAFVRDIKAYLSLARWSDNDSACVICIAGSLLGEARKWYDDWSLARTEYTPTELLAAIEARFAPRVRSRAVEARERLGTKLYAQNVGESVATYQSRFEALCSAIPDFTQGERVFWFTLGLLPELAAECAVDHLGQEFADYSVLIQHALGEERRLLAANQTRHRSSAPKFLAVQADEDHLKVEPPEAPSVPHAAATAPVQKRRRRR